VGLPLQSYLASVFHKTPPEIFHPPPVHTNLLRYRFIGQAITGQEKGLRPFALPDALFILA
jgi:hypothetical protein